MFFVKTHILLEKYKSMAINLLFRLSMSSTKQNLPYFLGKILIKIIPSRGKNDFPLLSRDLPSDSYKSTGGVPGEPALFSQIHIQNLLKRIF